MYNPDKAGILESIFFCGGPRISMVGGSGSGKTNALLNWIKHQLPDTEKTYLYTKDLFESKY